MAYPNPILQDITVLGTGSFQALSAAGLASLAGGGTLSGTFGGNPTFSGNPIFSGTPSLTGTLSQTNARTWSGAFPGTGNLGLYQNLTYSGTPSAGFPGMEGSNVPLNLIALTDSLGYPGQGGVSGLEIQHYYGGGSADWGRQALLVESQLTGTIGTSNPNYGSGTSSWA